MCMYMYIYMYIYMYNLVHINLQDAKHLGHAGVVPVAPLQPTATGWSNAFLWCREKCHGDVGCWCHCVDSREKKTSLVR